MFNQFLPQEKKLYLNDRHEEADTHTEDRRKLYDKRILPLLEEGDWAVFAEPINQFLWDYYQSLGLAAIKPENIFYAKDYLNYPSLTKAILNEPSLIEKIKKKKFDILLPYIESADTQKLARKIGVRLLREASFTDWINNKSNYRQVMGELGLPVVAGATTNIKKAEKDFKKIKSQGFKKAVLKKERSVSGFGVFVVEKLQDLNQCLKDNFKHQSSFVLEGFIEDIKCSPNFQYFISDKKITFLAATDQLLAQDRVSYSGNIYPPFLIKKPSIFRKIEEMSQKICAYLQSRKCFGLVGIDYIVTKKDQIYTTEANVRLNGSTFPVLIAERLFGREADVCWLFKTFYFPKISFEGMFTKLNVFLQRSPRSYGVFPVGVDLLESMGEGQFMIIAPDVEKLNCLRNKFANFKNF